MPAVWSRVWGVRSYDAGVRRLILISGRNRRRSPRGRGDADTETWRRRHDRAVVDALHDKQVRQLARSVDGLPKSSVTILLDFIDVLRAVEGLPPETADL